MSDPSIIKFKDSTGAEITTTPHTFKNASYFSVEIVYAGPETVKGEILKNGIKVGEVEYNSASGSRQNWYSGSNRFIPNKAGDVFRVNITEPFNVYKDLVVGRFQPALCGEVSYGRFLNKIRGAEFSSVPINDVLKTVHNEISAFMPHLGLSYKNDRLRDIKTVRDYFCDKMMLPTTKGFLYPDTASTANALVILKPPTAKEIFSKWDRFDANSYFKNGSTYTGNAASWLWNESLQSAQQPINTGAYNGFISETFDEYYEHEVTVSSTDGDNDAVTVILAFDRDETLGRSYHLSLVMAMGGVGVPSAHNVVHNFANNDPNSPTFVVTHNNFAGTRSGWSGSKSRVKVIRSGDDFEIYATPWGSNTYSAASKMTFNLNADPRLQRFKGPRKYGYGSYSQANSYFENIHFLGGILWNIVVDTQLNKVYRYVNGVWTTVTGLTAHHIFGAPRIVTDMEGTNSYLLNLDGTITRL